MFCASHGYAWRRQTIAIGNVQLCVLGAESADGSPFACHPQAGGRDSGGMSKQFDRLYSEVGRPSIPPERLLRALLLQVFYTIRSERLLMEELDYNLLYRWFVGLEIDDRVWHVTVYTKNRDRLLNQEVAQSLFEQGAHRGGESERSSGSGDGDASRRDGGTRCGAVDGGGSDAGIGQMVSELTGGGLHESTLIIITAKHGQSPVDTHRFVAISGTSPATLFRIAPQPNGHRPYAGRYLATVAFPLERHVDGGGDTGSECCCRRNRTDLLWTVAGNDVQCAGAAAFGRLAHARYHCAAKRGGGLHREFQETV
jgi:hypothetical protein